MSENRVINSALRLPPVRAIYLFFLQRLRNEPRLKRLLKGLIWKLPEAMKNSSAIRDALMTVSKRSDDVFFIEVGANDGLSGDVLREFIVTRHWNGVLVEPVDYLFRRLKENYEGTEGLVFEQAAISSQSGKKKLWYIEQSGDLPAGYDQLGSFDRDHVLKYSNMIPDIDNRLRCCDVECITLRDLVTRHSIDRIDVILIDVEGHDQEIVQQIDLDRFRPQVIVFEHCHLGDEQKQQCRSFLESHGYHIEEAGGNSIAFSAEHADHRG